MLIETIAFEIVNFKEMTIEDFLIEGTELNYEKVLQHRFTRNIRLGKTFDFQFASEKNVPVEFIEFSNYAENSIDEIDEMVGIVI